MPFVVLGLLPLLGLPLTVAAALTLWRSRGDALLAGLVGWGVTSAAAAQLLSLAHGLSRGPVLAVWAAYDVTTALLIWWGRDRLPLRVPRWRADRMTAAVVALVLAIWAVELFVDLVSPPTTWDSMTYHMARVAHWLQNRDVWHYPTAIDRQLWMGPWNEWVIAQIQAIAGNDAWANLVQWMEGIGSAVLAWLLARSLGLSRRAALFTFAAFATLPPAIMQGTNTESDMATTMWLLVFLVAAQRISRRASLEGAIVCGLALGLACLTKGSAFIFTAPFLVLWLVRCLRVSAPAGLRAAATAGIAAAVIVGPFLARNYAQWHDVLGPPHSVAFTNSDHRSVGGTVSTLVRATATQLTVPSTAVNSVTEHVAKAIVRVIGQDPNDPSNTFNGNTFGVTFARDEDYASAPLHLTLLAAGLVLLVLAARRATDRRMHAHAVAWLAAAVLFAGLIRWSVWNNRVELPLLAAGMPFAGAAVDRAWRWLPMIAVGLFGVSGFAWLAIDDARPLVSIAPTPTILTQSRQALYFEKRPDLTAPYQAAVNVIKMRHPTRVGLVMHLDDWEYPFFALSPQHGAHMTFFDARPEDWKGFGTMPQADLVVCTALDDPICAARPGWTLLLDGRVRVLAPA